MAHNNNISTNGRLIGKVEWYGGYNSKTGRDNKFGFLKGVENNRVFVHESGLLCESSDLEEGQWVTFLVVESEKGPSAIDVDL